MIYSLRRSRSGDEKKLKEIWKVCFDDTDEYIDSFFEKMYRPGMAVVAEAEAEAEAEGELCAAMYVLEVGNLASARCGYLYALGTLPNYRGKGIGAAVTKGAAELGFELGFEICVTCPAEQGLLDYYRKLGFVDFSRISRLTRNGSDIHLDPINGEIMSTSVEEYMELREKLMPENAVRYSREFMEFLAETLRQSGGGLFALGTGECIAAVEANGAGSISIKELLGNRELIYGTIELLCRQFGAERAFAAIPAEMCAAAAAHTMAVYRDAKAVDSACDAYFPFTLD